MLGYAREQLAASSDFRTKHNKILDQGQQYSDAEIAEKQLAYNVVNDRGAYDVPHLFSSSTRTLLSTDIDSNIVGGRVSDKINFKIDGTSMDKLKRVIIVQNWPVIKVSKKVMAKLVGTPNFECELKLCDYAAIFRCETTQLQFLERSFNYDSYDCLLRSVAEEPDPEYLDKCIGNEDPFTSWHTEIPVHTTRTPTRFGFENNDLVSLPLMYITSDITLSLTLRDLIKLVMIRYRIRNEDNVWSDWQSLSRDKITNKLLKDIKLEDPQLYVTYSKLSTEQRAKLFDVKKEYRLPFIMYKNNDTEVRRDKAVVTPKKCNAIKHYVAINNLEAVKFNDYTNFTDNLDKVKGWSPYTSVTVKHNSSAICEIPYQIITTENVKYYCSGRPRVKGFGVIGFQNEHDRRPYDPTHIPIEDYEFLFASTDIYELSKKKKADDDNVRPELKSEVLFRTVCQGEIVFRPTEKLTHDNRRIFIIEVIDF